MSPSDYILIGCLIASLAFAVNFSVGRPRVWYLDPLGWVIFLQALSVTALLGLIVYGIVFGQKVDEPWRLAVAGLLFVSLVSKNVILHLERERGRTPGERPRAKRKVRT